MNPFSTKKKVPASALVGSVANASKPSADPSAKNCPLKKHFVKVKLTFKDDKKPVPAAACKILLGAAEIDSGPLANGELGTAKTLEAGGYEVTFPEIDSAEWDVA